LFNDVLVWHCFSVDTEAGRVALDDYLQEVLDTTYTMEQWVCHDEISKQITPTLYSISKISYSCMLQATYLSSAFDLLPTLIDFYKLRGL
jgi:hypothetical protein